MFTLVVMVVFIEAGHRHGFQAPDSVHDGKDSDTAGISEYHQLTKRSPFIFKMMKFAKKKLNPFF